MKNLVVLPETGPDQPGQFLETRQRFGIVPTWAFWNRSDVWRTGRWFVTPVVGASIGFGLWLAVAVPNWAVPLVVLLLGPAPPMMVMGLLERYIRRKLGRPA